MKWLGLLCLLLGIGMLGETFVVGSQVGNDLRDLRACVDALKTEHAALRERIPHEVFTADRKLFQMSAGIPFLEDNYVQLEGRFKNATVTLDTILLANAVEGCRLFSSQFASRALQFQLLLANILLLIGILTLRAFFTMVPLLKPQGERCQNEDKPNDKVAPSATDRDSDRKPRTG